MLNTFILLLSGVTITYAHLHAIISGSKLYANDGLVFTIILAVTFTALQAYEYIEAPFNISDGIYGSTFYMATGFHGFHVIIGLLLLWFVSCGYINLQKPITLVSKQLAWYWHFVDVVWLFLFVTIYWFGEVCNLVETSSFIDYIYASTCVGRCVSVSEFPSNTLNLVDS